MWDFKRSSSPFAIRAIPKKVEDMMLNSVKSVKEALDKAIEDLNYRNPGILVIPEGPSTLPYLAGSPVEEEIKRIKE